MLEPPALSPLLTTGSILRREALDLGLSSKEVEHLVRTGVWTRIRRGAYAPSEVWRAASAEARHLVLARAVLRALDEPAVLSHVSAAVAHGLPVWGADLSRVHVVRPAARQGARTEGGVVHHAAALPAEHVTQVGGVPATIAARTVIDHARSTPFEPAVTTADAALHLGLATQADLREVLFWMHDWPQVRGAGRVVAFADGRPETVGESRGRVFFHRHGFPEPEMQVEIRDAHGVLLARADFLFRAQRTIGEFDGRVKYRVGTSSLPPEEVVWLEKQREDGVRALGWQVVRWVWDDYDTPVILARRFTRAFERGGLWLPLPPAA
jgi:hypothetical protein